MLSTGEVACLGENFVDALSKALQSAEFNLPPDGGSVLITVGGKKLKKQVIPVGKALRQMGFKIYATKHTGEALQAAGVNNISILYNISYLDALALSFNYKKVSHVCKIQQGKYMNRIVSLILSSIAHT